MAGDMIATPDQYIHARIKFLDIARGVAVFGILTANMRFFSASQRALRWGLSLWPGTSDQVVQVLIDIFVTNKFLAIFAFLFGYGSVIARDRAASRGLRFQVIFRRRLLVLLLFGLIHAWFIWYGDILFHYALLGLVMLQFHNREPGQALGWALVLLLAVPSTLLLTGVASSPPELAPDVEMQVRHWIAADEAAYTSSSYRQVQAQRMTDWRSSVVNGMLFYPGILAMMLLGVYFSEQRWFHDVGSSRAVLRKIAWVTGLAGIPLNVAVPVLKHLAAEGWTPLLNQLEVARLLVAAPLMGLFYLTVMALWLAGRDRWLGALEPLARVGRMALTNYILQSKICTFIFYGYGLGWFGRVSPTGGIILATGIFLLQVLGSSLWLRYFPAGPLERLWRVLTYGKEAPANWLL